MTLWRTTPSRAGPDHDDLATERRWEDLVKVDVVTEIMIDRSIEQVASYACDPANATEWYVNILAVEWETPPPARVQVAFVARFLGRRLAYTDELVELVPNHRLVMRTAQGPFPIETTYTWDAVKGGTLMTLRNRGQPAGFSKAAAPIMSAAMRRTNRKDLAKLRSILEASE